MSMVPMSEQSIPAETARVARAVLSPQHPFVILRDQLNGVYQDAQFADLYARQGPAAESPGRLALVTVLQFAEGLTDEQASQAVRTRIDWKYLLGLELTDLGFDASVLSEFRDRLVTGQAAERLLTAVLEVAQARGLLKGHGKQRTDSTHVLDAVRSLQRLELVGEAMRQALNDLAGVVPDWIQARAPTVWYERYSHRFETYRLPHGEAARQALTLQIGEDGRQLLTWLSQDESVACLRRAPAVEALRRIWVQNFSEQDGQMGWRHAGNLPPAARMIVSPYDIEARYSKKREMTWEGYKVHVTETCEPDAPHLIVHTLTTPATTPDLSQTTAIQAALEAHGLLPAEHYVDTGYVDGDVLVASHTRGIDLVAPVKPDDSWQACQHPAFALAQFNVNWPAQQVTCPQGHLSQRWSQRDADSAVRVRFRADDCRVCPTRTQCVHSASATSPRILKLQPQAKSDALCTARAYRRTDEFQLRYRIRAGIEATLSQGVRAFDMRASRYIGLAKTHLQQVAVSVAINFQRLADWLSGKAQSSRVYRAPFPALKPAT